MAGTEEILKVRQSIIDLDKESTGKAVIEAIRAGASTQDIIEKGMKDGMSEVGRKYEAGEFYLAELVLSAEAMQKGLDVLESEVPWEAVRQNGTVVLATVKGDMHDTGKNIVASMLSASGFKVIDLGVDVPSAAIVDAVREESAGVLGLSLVLPSQAFEVGNTVKALEESGLREGVKVVLGGAGSSPELAREMGCDAHVGSAFDAARVIEALVKGS